MKFLACVVLQGRACVFYLTPTTTPESITARGLVFFFFRGGFGVNFFFDLFLRGEDLSLVFHMRIYGQEII